VKITLNGQETAIEPDETLALLIERLEIKGQVAASVNDDIIHQSGRETLTLQEGDTVEIFTMLGGG